MDDKILCDGCGKVYPLWIPAGNKPANCSECGAQIEQRALQPQIAVSQPSAHTQPVVSSSTNDIDFQLIFFNTAIIGTAFLLIVAVLWVGSLMYVSEPPIAATSPNTPAQADPSVTDQTSISADDDNAEYPEPPAAITSSSSDNPTENKPPENKPPENNPPKNNPPENNPPENNPFANNPFANKSPENKSPVLGASINDIYDETSVGRSVGLVQLALAVTEEDEQTKYYKNLLKTVSADEFDLMFDSKQQKYLSKQYPIIQGEQLIPAGGSGTCFLVTADGFAITNLHVVEDYLDAKSQRDVYKEIEDELGEDVSIRPELFVYLDAIPHNAEVIYNSNEFDLAILKIESVADHPYFRLASTNSILRKTKVTALGFPASSRGAFTREESIQDYKNSQSEDPRNWFKDSDLEYVATSGEVSKVSERDGDGLVVQHTATVDQGNSGGPLVTNEGVVLGINTWQRTRVRADGGIEGVGLNLSLSMHSLFNDIRRNSLKVQWVDSLPKPGN